MNRVEQDLLSLPRFETKVLQRAKGCLGSWRDARCFTTVKKGQTSDEIVQQRPPLRDL